MTEQISSIQLDGNNNVVIQKVEGSTVTVNTISWDDFVKKYTLEQQTRIAELQTHLAERKELYDLKVLKLSAEINELKEEVTQKETQLKGIIQQYEKRDLTQTSALYQKAFQYFMEGDLDLALEELEEAKLEEEEKQQAESRILKANILKLKYKFKEAEKNLIRASQIFPSWGNTLTLANFYRELNRFPEAEASYQDCLGKARSSDEKADTLNNLGNLQRDKNELSLAEISYQEALGIRRQLAPLTNASFFSSDTYNESVLAQYQNQTNEVMHVFVNQAYDKIIETGTR